MISSIDVVIAAWNRADTIERAMLSALSQPEVRTVIVIDDFSSDDTETIARGIAVEYGTRVIFTRLPVNCGPAAARNVGLELSNSPWIAILDGDDYFLPGRARDLLSYADSFDFVADNLLQVKEDEDQDCRSNLLEVMGEPWKLDLKSFVHGNVRRRGRLRKELGFIKPIIRRAFLDRHRLRYDETLRLGEDYAFYARALLAALASLLFQHAVTSRLNAPTRIVAVTPRKILNAFATSMRNWAKSRSLQRASDARFDVIAIA